MVLDQMMTTLTTIVLIFVFCCCSSSCWSSYFSEPIHLREYEEDEEDEEDEEKEDVVIVPPKTHRDILVNYGRVGCADEGQAIKSISQDQDSNSLVAVCDETDTNANQTRRIKRFRSVSNGSHLDKIVDEKLTPGCKSDEVLNNFQYFKEGSSGMRLEYSCVQVLEHGGTRNRSGTTTTIENTEYDINTNKFGGLDNHLGAVNCAPTDDGYNSALNNFMLTRDDADKINFETNCQINFKHTALDPLVSISAVVSASDNTVTVTYVAGRLCTITFTNDTIEDDIIISDVDTLLLPQTYTEAKVTTSNLTLNYTATSTDDINSNGNLSLIHYSGAFGIITTNDNTTSFKYELMDGMGAGTGENEIGSFSDTDLFTITKDDNTITITSVDQDQTAIIQIVDHTVLRLKAVADDDSVSEPLEIVIANIMDTDLMTLISSTATEI
jgi:hypothetical protein